MTSDAELIRQVRQGDAQAYGIIVDRYETVVFAAVMAVVRHRHTAEDIAQEVFVQAYSKLGGLRDDTRFGVWLMRIARRRATQALRRSRAGPGFLCDRDPAEIAAREPFLEEEKEHLHRHVRRLPAHEQLALALRYFQGHSVQEIASMTGRPVGTVTKRLSRAIDRLRRSLASENAPCQTRHASSHPSMT